MAGMKRLLRPAEVDRAALEAMTLRRLLEVPPPGDLDAYARAAVEALTNPDCADTVLSVIYDRIHVEMRSKLD